MSRFRGSSLGSLLLLAALAACGDKPQQPPEPGKPAPAPTPEVLAKLAKADAVDGKTDMVVHQCGGCQLGMEGKPEHALPVGDYKMEFCSKGCYDAFAKDPNGQILAMKLPQK